MEKNIDKKNSIPVGTTDYYGFEARLRDYVLSVIAEIYQKYGFESLYTPLFENDIVFRGHHGEGEKILFTMKDKLGEPYVLKYDSTVPLARVISMHNDIILPYKRYQLQQSYRDDEIDKGHFREFVQCDGDVVGTDSLITDAEFVQIAYDGLSKLGFNDYTIRLNHRKLIKAIADKANINDKPGLLQIQRAIDLADKVNKGGIKDIEIELKKAGIEDSVVKIILELVLISKSNPEIITKLNKINNYFGVSNHNAKSGTDDLKQIIDYLPDKVKKTINIDFTLARGADYYTGFIIEAVINNLKLGAVLGGGRYDNLVEAFSDKKVPAVGMAFGMERLIVAMKELGLDKRMVKNDDTKLLLYVADDKVDVGAHIAGQLREKYNVSVILESELAIDKIVDYCNNSGFSIIVTPTDEYDYKLYKPDEFYEEKTNVQIRKLTNNK